MNKERLYSIDILKFIAALCIFCEHLNQCVGISFNGSDFVFHQIGLYGFVDLFFLISGFLCTFKYVKSDFDEFIKHKVKKLYPLATLSIVVTVILMIIYKIIYKENWFDTELGLWRIFTSLTLTFIGGPNNVDIGINNPMWYICVLMLCFSIFWILNRNDLKDKKYLFLLMSFFALGIHEYSINLPFLNLISSRGYASFFLGCYFCELYKTNSNLFFQKNFFCSNLLLLIAISIITILDYSHFIDNKWCINAYIVYPAIFFVFLYLNKYIKFPKLSILSNLSYSIYVWQVPFIIILNIIGVRQCGLLGLCFYITIIICWSIVSVFVIERKLQIIKLSFEQIYIHK